MQTTRPGQTPPEWLRALQDAAPRVDLLETARLARRTPAAARPLGGRAGHRAVRRARERAVVPDRLPGRLFAGHLPRPARQPARLAPPDAARARRCSTASLTPARFRSRRRRRARGRSSVDLSRALAGLGQGEFPAQRPRPRRRPGTSSSRATCSSALRRFAANGARASTAWCSTRRRSRATARAGCSGWRTISASSPRWPPACSRPAGWMLCSSNARRLTPAGFRRLVLSGLPDAGRAVALRSAAPMPPDFTGAPYLQTLWVRREGRSQ